ncbi:MFS transporter [Microvirga sp. 3-52]|nr:MFS transporter [Microvirga sp. 3-52]
MPSLNAARAYALFTFLSFTMVGVGIVLPAWIAFQVGGSRLVGWVLLASSLSGVVLAPLAGHLVDHGNRNRMAIVGQAIRSVGMAVTAAAAVLPEIQAAVGLMAAAIMGSFGFAVLSGSLSGILQELIPAERRTSFVLRLSVARQVGIAVGTGIAGAAIHYLGGSATAIVFVAVSSACILLLRYVPTSEVAAGTAGRPGLLTSNLKALRYLAARPQCMIASVTVGLAYSVVQVTNLLLPGFVTDSLHGGSSLFGTLEMTAAIAGAVSAMVASTERVAKLLQERTLAVLTIAGLALAAFSFTTADWIAIPVYALAGILWSIARALANAYLLLVVDNAMIGRVQAFTTLITSVVVGI